MARPLLALTLLVPALALPGCGTKNVDTASYTCGQFNKSLKTKGDNTAGNYINQLRKQAQLGQPKQTEVRELTLGIFLACRNKPASTQPADKAITTAKNIRSGKFSQAAKAKAAKKKSSK